MNRRILITALAAWIGTGVAALAADGARVKAWVGARIIDGTGKPAIERGTIIVQDGRIQQVGAADRISIPVGAETINATGKTIVPGLINTHGHVGAAQGLRAGPDVYTQENLLRQLGLYARYGVTTVFSLGGDQEEGFRLRDTQDTPALDRARIYVAGTVITGKTPEEAQKQVDAVSALKPDFIKIRVDDNLGTSPKMPPEVYRAVIQRAHANKLPVASHMFYLDDARGLLEAGTDFLAHSIRDREVDAGTIALLKKRGICLCPTLTREVSAYIYESRPAFFDDPFFLKEAERPVLDQLLDPKKQDAMHNSAAAQRYKVALDTASRNLKKLEDAGVAIAFGTDTGPPARFQGYFEHLELELMAKAGLTPMQILKSATGDAARCMRLAGKIGTLVRGAWADLIVLAKNPLDDIRNLRSIESVWIAGNRLPGR